MTSVRLTAQQVAAIRALESETGRITPQRVVAAARDAASPLHPLFDWDVARAAENWWTHRAREIIASVHYVYNTTEFTVKAPAYVVNGDGAGYRSVVRLQSDEAAARDALMYALETAAGHIRRAVSLAPALGMSMEVDHLLESICGVQRLIRGVPETTHPDADQATA